MLKEIKYFVFTIIIVVFIFFTCKYYFSDLNKKKSYRSLLNIDQKIELFSKKLPVLENDTQNIIEFVKNNQSNKKKKYQFWELLKKDDK
tara:strand:+ start:2409 stop:2675 length:267 start_codon:yes stop_codon:yes gene_type:complete